MTKYSIGLDFGTSSCRSVVVDLATGKEVAEGVYAYQHGEGGVLTSPSDADVARQSPQDYIDGTAESIRIAVDRARAFSPDFDAADVVGISVATTGSTIVPIAEDGTPLALRPEFDGRLDAQTWLWKDHTSHSEAAAITDRMQLERPEYLTACGGTYSAEWFWAKIWRCSIVAPDVFEAAYSWVELCDFVPGILTGTSAPSLLRRGLAAAGHKALFSPLWGGLPDDEFLRSLSPALADLRPRLFEQAYGPTDAVGMMTAEWAERTGLREGIPVGAGTFDAYAAGISGGVRPGTYVMVMGTSTCDVTVVDVQGADIPTVRGMCGLVNGSLLPNRVTIEAGQSAVGDIFNWFADTLLDASDPGAALQALGLAAAAVQPGEHGLVALDWFNGNRSVLVDHRLTGGIVGLSLHTAQHHLFKALVEATAFGARRIIDTIEQDGFLLDRIVAAGGLPSHASWMLQTYADILGRDIVVARSSQGTALGAALLAAVVGGHVDTIEQAQDGIELYRPERYRVRAEAAAVYDEIYDEFLALHDAFGNPRSRLGQSMKRLLDIRDRITAA